MMNNKLKSFRLLIMMEILIDGGSFSKNEMVNRFQVNEKTILRDVYDLKYFFKEISKNSKGTLFYDRKQKCYMLEDYKQNELTNKEILAVCKILLESRALKEDEMIPIIDKLEEKVLSDKDRENIYNIIINEKHNYLQLKHKKNLIDMLWDMTRAINNQLLLKITYTKPNESEAVKRTLEPVGIIFSEFYFYLIAYIENKSKDFPIIYRIDRINKYTVMKNHFRIEYSKRFEDSEMRKRIHFMQGGNIQKIEFKFWGESLEAVIDKLPTAKILKQENGVTTIEADIYGRGAKMWFLSQMEYLEIIKPESFRNEMENTIRAMLDNYK